MKNILTKLMMKKTDKSFPVEGNQECCFTADEIRTHTYMIGTTSIGKTSNAFKPELNEKEKEEQRMKQKMREDKEKIREAKIKLNYLNMFNSFDEIKDEMYDIFDCSNEFYGKEIENIDEFLTLYLNIKHSVFCCGLQWGFSDTEFRDDCYRIFKNKKYDELRLYKEDILDKIEMKENIYNCFNF